MRRYFTTFLVGLSLTTTLGFAAPALADTGPTIDMVRRLQPFAKVFNQNDILDSSTPQSDAIQIVINIINVFLSFLALIFIALIIYGGFLWMTARGNDDQVTTAKKTLYQAIIGLVVIISAYVIINIVINILTKQIFK